MLQTEEMKSIVFCMLFHLSLYADLYPPKPRMIEFDLNQNESHFLSTQRDEAFAQTLDYFTKMEKYRDILKRYDSIWRVYADLLIQEQTTGEIEGTMVEISPGEFIKTKWYILEQMKKVYLALKTLQKEIYPDEPLDIDLEWKETFEKALQREKEMIDLRIVVTEYGYLLCVVRGDEFAQSAYKNPVQNPSIEERTTRANDLIQAVALWKLAIRYAPEWMERSVKERTELFYDLIQAYAYLGFKKEMEDLIQKENLIWEENLDPLIQQNVAPTTRNNPYGMPWAKELLIREKGIWDREQYIYIGPIYDLERGKIVVQTQEMYAELDEKLRFEYLKDLKK